MLQLLWTGGASHVCSVAAGTGTLLAGALPDALLLLQPAPGAAAGWQARNKRGRAENTPCNMWLGGLWLENRMGILC